MSSIYKTSSNNCATFLSLHASLKSLKQSKKPSSVASNLKYTFLFKSSSKVKEVYMLTMRDKYIYRIL